MTQFSKLEGISRKVYFKRFVFRWSYGVVLWEIATLGKVVVFLVQFVLCLITDKHGQQICV